MTVGIIALLAKATVDVSRDVLKARQDKAQVKKARAQADIEEAKTYGIALLKGKDGSEKPGIIAFCPAHIDHVERITTLEAEARHINADLAEIKDDVKVIRVAVGK